MFIGVYTALITPFHVDETVNFEKIEELVEFNIKKGVKGLVICGTTGESTTLTKEEKKDIIDKVIKVNNKRVQIVVGVSSNNTMESIDFVKELANRDIDGFMVLTPFYNKTNEEGNFKHFEEISNSTIKPIIVYNVPSRTGVDLSVSEIVNISKIKNIVAIKEASTNVNKIKELKEKTSLRVLLGNDDLFLEGLKLNADGIISVFTNIFPEVFVEIFNEKEKEDLFYKYIEFIKILSIEPNPIPIKQALNLIGLEVGGYRLPIYKMGEESRKILLKELWEVI